MSSPVYIVSPGENVAHARNLMLKHRISRLPVIEAECLVGIITKKDIGYRLRQSEPIWRRRPIDHIPVSILMTRDPLTVRYETGVGEIASLIDQLGYQQPPGDGRNRGERDRDKIGPVALVHGKEIVTPRGRGDGGCDHGEPLPFPGPCD